MFEEYNKPQKQEQRIAKGYRLKISTHSLIKSLQELTQDDADTVITESCILLHKKIIEEKENKFNNK